MKFEDVTDDDLKPKVKPVSDDEYIKKSIQALQTESIQKANVSKGSEVINSKEFVIEEKPTVIENANYYVINDIPSKYKLYPEGTQIIGRRLKVLEIKKLASINETTADFIINDLLKRTIRGIDINKLLVADKLYILMWLRANTYKDSGYNVSFKCSKCNTESSYHFETNNLEVEYLSDSYDGSQKITLDNGDVLGFKFLRIEDEVTIDRFKEINGKVVGEIDEEFLKLAQMITDINGDEKSIMQKYLYLTADILPTDYSRIMSYINKFGMGIKPYLNVKCENCSGVTQTMLSFDSSFFFPEYKVS